MTRKERYENILAWFSKNRPDVQSELNFASPYQLLVAVVLSAQCTDKRVNMVTPALFEQWPDAASLSRADFDDVLDKVKSVSYPNAKARHLIAMAQKLVSDFGGEVPSTGKELESLPGVGHKTANVVISVCFGGDAIAVDTHVFRVSRRTGLSSGRTVRAVENDLVKNIAPELRGIAHHWLLLHGRYECTARSPKCSTCGISQWCQEYSKTNKTNNKQ